MISKQKRLMTLSRMKAKKQNKKKEVVRSLILIALLSTLIFFLIKFAELVPNFIFGYFIKNLNDSSCFSPENKICLFTFSALAYIFIIWIEFAFMLIPGIIFGGILIKEKIKKKKISNVENSLKIASAISFVIYILIEKISGF